VLLGRPGNARAELLADTRAQLDRRPVRADADEVAGGDPARGGIGRRQLDLGVRPLELAASGRWNWSSGTRSTAGPAKSGR